MNFELRHFPNVPPVAKGESVESFLKRGGKIKKVAEGVEGRQWKRLSARRIRQIGEQVERDREIFGSYQAAAEYYGGDDLEELYAG